MSDTHKLHSTGISITTEKYLSQTSIIFLLVTQTHLTHSPKHQTLSPNHKFFQRISYVEYYTCTLRTWHEVRNFA